MDALHKRLDALRRKRMLEEEISDLSQIGSLRITGYEEVDDKTQTKLNAVNFAIISTLRTFSPFAIQTIGWVKEILVGESIKGEFLFKYYKRDRQYQLIPWLRIYFESYDWVDPLWQLGGALSFLNMSKTTCLRLYANEYVCFAEKADLT